jgi:hypothetical protein
MKHFVIPDTQVKQGVRLNHLTAAGNYIAAKKPDVVIHLGDHWDMHSLSKYDEGKRASEGARYNADIEAGIEGMDLLTSAIAKAGRGYKPRKIFLLGNHEQRIERHVETYPILEGKLSYEDFKLKQFGWEVHDYLKIVCVNGVHYSHYFHPTNSQNAYGGKCPQMLNNIGFSFTQGHRPGLDVAMKPLANGKVIRGLVAGSFYQHDEIYKGHQGNHHWRGCIMKHEVKDGNYGLLEISLKYLLKEWL